MSIKKPEARVLENKYFKLKGGFMSKIAVIGGCGRLGLKLSLILANKGHQVTAIDLDEERITELKGGNLPFVETGAEIFLEEALKNRTLKLSLENDLVTLADVIIITIGTPVDSNLNPTLEPIAGVIFDIADYIKEKQLIIFRNTLSPTIAKRLKTLIEDKTRFKVGKEIFLAFAPEISNETNINNLLNAPQPIGTYDEKSFEAAKKFFETVTKGKITNLTPEEVLLAKLMNNMSSYVQSAVANEFYLVAESYGANIHKILEATNSELRTQPPKAAQLFSPNLNVSGPGTHKEGWFLVDRLPFAELITTAFKINESMVNHMIRKLEGHKINKVGILGMTNKPNSDDTSSSLSYKLRKALYYKDYEVGCYDPFLPEYSDSLSLRNSDVIILMTPHNEFKDFEKIQSLVNNPNCIYIDIGGFWKETREQGRNGIWQHKEEKVKEKSREKRKK